MPHRVRYLAESILAGLFAFLTADDLLQFINEILEKRTQIPTASNDQKSKYGFFLSLQPAKHIMDIDQHQL